MKTYNAFDTLVANTPYLLMVLAGAATIALALGLDSTALAWAGGYAAYGVAGSLWIMVFVCPSCAFFGTHSCPCGYGTLAARLRSKAPAECFASKFRRHIPVIVPLWLIPPAVGGVMLYKELAWPTAAALAIFALDAFVVLPLVSTKHGCADCPQKTGCPWMGKSAA
jgi:hypothetical protein